MNRSVLAFIQSRDHDGNQFPLDTRNRAISVHRFDIQFMMQAHDPGMNRMDLDDVIGIIDPLGCRELI